MISLQPNPSRKIQTAAVLGGAQTTVALDKSGVLIADDDVIAGQGVSPS